MNVGKLNVILTARVRGLLSKMRQSQAALEVTREKMGAVARSATVMTASLAGTAAALSAVAGRFEKQMTRVAAISSASASDFDRNMTMMSARALELAAKTEFTAQQVGEGMQFMAMAGMDAATTMAAMPAVLQLASAASMDLGRSADIVTNVMAGFGKQASDLGNVNNTLVATMTGSNVSLTELGEAMKVAGPSANNLKVELEDVSAALGLLGNAGIKASLAGTGLRRAMTALTKTTPNSAKAFDVLGVSAKMLTDKNKGIGSIISTLEGTKAAFEEAGMEAEYNGLLMQAFGDRAGPQMAALVEQGADAFDSLNRKIEGAKATNLAEFLQTKQVETFVGQMNILKSNIERVAIAFGQQLIPLFLPLIEKLKSGLKALGDWSEGSIRAAIDMGKMIAAGVALVGGSAAITTTLTGIAAGLAAMSSAATSSGISMGVLAAGPLAALAAGVVGFRAGQLLMIATTGESVDAIGALKGAMSFASEGFAQAEATVTNFVVAMAQAAVQAVSLGGLFGAIDIDFGGFAGGISDSARAAQDLNKETRDILAVDTEIPQLVRQLKEMGAQFETVVYQGKRLDGTMRDISVTQAKLGVKQGINVADLDDARRINERIVELTKQKFLAQRQLNENAKKAAEAVKKSADDAAKAEADKLKRATERIRAELKALKVAQKLANASEDQLKAISKIANLQKSAMRGQQLAAAGGNAPVLQAAFGFEDASETLRNAFTKAGKPLSEMEPILNDLRSTFQLQVAEFLKGKEGTAEYTAAVSMAEEVLGAFGLEVLAATKNLSGMTSTKARIAPLEFNQGLSETTASLTDSLLQLEARLNDAGLAQDEVTGILESEMVKRLRSISDIDELNKTMGSLEEISDALGVSFGDVKKQVGELPQFSSIEDAVSQLSFAGLSGTVKGLDPGAMKNFTKMVGSEFGGAIKGQAPNIGGIIGGAIGTIFGQPAIGGAIGSAITGLFGSITNAITSAASALGALIPEERIGKAIGLGAAVAAVLIPAVGVAGYLLVNAVLGIATMLAPIAAALAVALAPLPLLAPLLLVFAAALAVALVPLVPLWAAQAALAAAFGLLVVTVLGVTAMFASALGVLALVSALAMKSPAFERFKTALSAAVDVLLETFGPLDQVLMPLAGLFSTFLRVLMPFVSSFVTGLVAMRESIFTVAQGIAVTLGNFLLVTAYAANGLIEFTQAIGPAFIGLADIMAGFGDIMNTVGSAVLDVAKAIIGWVPGMGEMVDSITAQQQTLASMASVGNDVRNAVEDIIGGLDSFRLDPTWIQNAIDAVGNLTLDEAQMIGERLAATKETQDALNEALTNVPEGFKVAAERWNAIAIGDTGPSMPGADVFTPGAGTAPIVNNYFAVENLNVTDVNDPQELVAAVSEVQERMEIQQFGTPMAGATRSGGSG